MYELIDFGEGRKLERFGSWVLDRPCPAAGQSRRNREAWKTATARYTGRRTTDGKWSPAVSRWSEDTAQFEFDAGAKSPIRLQLAPLPSGQIGVFPEQTENWKWIVQQIAGAPDPVRVLNLFAYTGGSTLAAAAAGAEVTHIDAARSMVARARNNAAASGLAERPIRWIVEDALKFCRRELKRGNQYDAVILDPPSYGHGPKDESWSIERDLLPLLQACRELTQQRRVFLLATCHTPSIGPAELSAYFSEGVFGHCAQPPRTGTLRLQSADGRKLPSGVFARWPG